jgi:Na+/phosphate symporter
MNTTLTLVDLGGAIALLIWGVHMVQTGITRAFGPQLRRMLDLLRKSGEFLVSNEELDETATTVYEGI